MSRPHLHIDTLTYATASSVLSLTWTFYKLRGAPGGTISVNGIPTPFSFNEIDSNSDDLGGDSADLRVYGNIPIWHSGPSDFGTNQQLATFSVVIPSGTYSVNLTYPLLGGKSNFVTLRF